MVQSVRQSKPPAQQSPRESGDDQSGQSFNLADHLRANPEIVWDDLREQVTGLAEALIAARMQLSGPDGDTREDIVLDLYDEELLFKREAHELGPFEDSEFYDAVIARRRVRMQAQK